MTKEFSKFVFATALLLGGLEPLVEKLSATTCTNAFQELGTYVSSVSYESSHAIQEMKTRDALRYEVWITQYKTNRAEPNLNELASISGFPATSWAQVYGREHPHDAALSEKMKKQNEALKPVFDELKRKAKLTSGEEKSRFLEEAAKIALMMQMSQELRDVINAQFVPFPQSSKEQVSQFIENPPYKSEQEIQIRLYHAEVESAEILKSIRASLADGGPVSILKARRLETLSKEIDFYQELKIKLRAQVAVAKP